MIKIINVMLLKKKYVYCYLFHFKSFGNNTEV